ncbi:LOW QUALITY PROTEIN: hypothetical protein ACHAXT_013316 [Thalassiosira profunda]
MASYSLEMSSQEEGVVVDLPLQPVASSRDDNDAPTDEEEEGTCDVEDTSPAPLVSETAEPTAGGAGAASSPLMTVAVKSGARRRRKHKADDDKNNVHVDGALRPNGLPNDDESKGIGPPPPSPSSYYTTRPRHWSFLPHPMSFSQMLREYRHNSCLMTPMAALVLLAICTTSLVALLLTVPQFLMGILLGPLVKRNFWLVEFLYRYDIARWGHVKIMELAGKKKRPEHPRRNGGPGPKKLEGHSNTLGQRIEVVPGRVYVHPIPQFMDNVAYLIVCLPPSTAKSLPILGVLVDCGESAKVSAIHSSHLRTSLREGVSAERVQGRQGTGRGHRDMRRVVHASAPRPHRGVGSLKNEVVELRRKSLVGTGKTMYVTSGCANGAGKLDVYTSIHNNVLVGGAAVEMVPHCNLFLKNGCFVPLPCISICENGENAPNLEEVNDMNALVSIEVIGVPSHTRGSVVYALRNRAAPGIAVPIHSDPMQANPPLQSHLFTGDAIFTGGGGVPFEADYEFARDNFVKSPKNLKNKHGGSNFRPGAGTLSMERCFAEVLARAPGPWTSGSAVGKLPQDAAIATDSSIPGSSLGSTLLYPGHEYTTDLAHRRSLPPNQKLLTIPTPLEREVIVNTNFRMLKRRGECVVNALRLWYEFGAKEIIPDADESEDDDESDVFEGINPTEKRSVFTTVYSADLASIVEDLRSGKIDPAHKNVYLGVVALAVLGAAPSAVTSSDANIMDMAPPVDSTDRILISKKRLISILDGMGLLAEDKVAHATRYYGVKLDIEHPDGTDVECSVHDGGRDDEIELGLLKLALFGVAFGQQSKICLPCGDSRKPQYDEDSWVTTSKLRRTNGELVRHDVGTCLLCRDVMTPCPHAKGARVAS